MNKAALNEAKDKLLAAVDDLRDQVERGEIHALAYVAVAHDGTNVVTSLTNGVIRPVTLLGALAVMNHRLIEVIASGPTIEYSPGSTDEPEPMN